MVYQPNPTDRSSVTLVAFAKMALAWARHFRHVPQCSKRKVANNDRPLKKCFALLFNEPHHHLGAIS